MPAKSSTKSASKATANAAPKTTKKSKKVTTVVEEQPVEVKSTEPVVPDYTQADASAPEAAAEPVVSDNIGKQFEGIIQTLSVFRQSITALQTQIRGLE
jgi:hypothetical protein